MNETEQINLCIDEMAKLKEKMEALEKQKILNEKNEMLKKTTMEPNLKVLEDWLVDYHKAIEEKKERIKKGPMGSDRKSNVSGKLTKEETAASHIEATYNMFNIINKRLDDIEKKVGINN